MSDFFGKMYSFGNPKCWLRIIWCESSEKEQESREDVCQRGNARLKVYRRP